VRLLLVPSLAAIGVLLLYVVFAPLFERFVPALAPSRVGPPEPAWLPSRPVTSRVAIAPAPRPGEAPFRRVAVALELGPAEGPVLAHLITMTRAPETGVVLVPVAESAASRYLGAETSDKESREDTEQLERTAVRMREYGLNTRMRLGHGEVAKELARLV